MAQEMVTIPKKEYERLKKLDEIEKDIDQALDDLKKGRYTIV